MLWEDSFCQECQVFLSLVCCLRSEATCMIILPMTMQFDNNSINEFSSNFVSGDHGDIILIGIGTAQQVSRVNTITDCMLNKG